MNHRISIEDYQIQKDKNYKLGPMIVIFIMFLIVNIILISNLKFDEHIEFNLVSLGNSNYRVIVPINVTETIVDNDRITINKKRYKYKVISIDDNYLYQGDNIFQNIVIEIKDKNRVKNSIIKGNIIMKQNRIYESLIEFIKEG